ncbi:helix-turn-helix domain-containing protein [Enterococcus faecalis]|uniref:helix-turn-helix domain-containing protein n=1 Tax=Enterococcus faecalis TaxID=1351 RepID=UPI000CF21DDA|nr:helix-turn-helix domain-containing protein [Enterococcus faecalis]EHU9667826.1 helix-turn-helix domain-containing protein [Enterococcus faecalis]MBB2152877.1 helix-turn-helix domain-containing protein [Enterococcus faecalis]PQE89248.1 M protein trans-acting positive regulator [Enterococcus faecalis]PQF58374.1 M protein trans-acting positive regulator [Enterococcus faecalis]PQG05939.1 M protein trans-acting positive regulator [Enterococcus faecalis]
MEILDTFFGSEVKKELDLLRLLYHKKNFIRIETLSQLLQMDRRSINKYYESLINKPYVLANNCSHIFSAERGKGYCFMGSKKEYKILTKQILQSSPYFTLLEKLFFESNVHLTKFSMDQFLSESTVRHKVAELDTILKTFDFSIQRTKGEIRLVGAEPRIRFFMIALGYFPANQLNMKLICYILAVNIIRYRKGFQTNFLLSESISSLSDEDQEVLLQFVDTHHLLKEHLENQLTNAFLLPKSESHLIFLFLLTNTTVQLSNKHFTDLIEPNRPFSETNSFIKKILHSLETENPHAFETTKNRVLFTKQLVAGLLFVELFEQMDFTLTGYNIKKYLLQNFAHLFEHAQKIVTEQDIYVSNPAKQTGLGLQLSMAYTLITAPTAFNQTIHIKIETDLPTPIEAIIIQRIRETFASFYHLAINQLSEEDRYDLYLSTTPLLQVKQAAPFLLINAQVSLSDLLAIQEQLVRLVAKK